MSRNPGGVPISGTSALVRQSRAIRKRSTCPSKPNDPWQTALLDAAFHNRLLPHCFVLSDLQ